MRQRLTSTNSANGRLHLSGVLVAALLGLVATSGTASAQVATVREIVDLLVTNQSVQTGDFVKDRAAAEAASAALGQALLVSLTTLPTGASSAGFTYRFNPSLGTLERTTTNFGPSFVERAVTSGKGRVAFGTTWQYASFTRLDDRRLHDEGLVTTANRFLDEADAFDVERLTLAVRSQIVTGSATVGVTDRLDVAVAVPFVWLDLDGTRTDTYRARRSCRPRPRRRPPDSATSRYAPSTISSIGEEHGWRQLAKSCCRPGVKRICLGQGAARPGSWRSRQSSASTWACTRTWDWASAGCPTR